MLLNKFTIFHKACLISLVITFFKIFYEFTRKIETFKTIKQPFLTDAILYFTLTAVFWLSCIAVQTTSTWLFVITMLIANHTVHSTRSKHNHINTLFWHFHNILFLSKIQFVELLYIHIVT
ncbi:putative membrane protein [Clostridioides difficile P71]|nr:putative membrane protein [Clostridioides difficile CD175]EQK25601.1 putative membrane protein [Clostridioides difficile P71]